MEWDNACEYIYSPWKLSRKSVYAGASAALIALSLFTAIDYTRPKYRAGELTIEEFAENYNFYMTTTNEDTARRNLLRSDGTYYPKDSNSIDIHMGGKPENENLDFEYVTSDGYIERIIYKNYWRDVGFLTPTTNTCQIAVYTLLMSQPEVDIDGIKQFLSEWETERDHTVGTVSYKNIEIHWEYTLENCEMVGKYIRPVDDAVIGNANIYIEIIVK